jgi:hypothetical protein
MASIWKMEEADDSLVFERIERGKEMILRPDAA